MSKDTFLEHLEKADNLKQIPEKYIEIIKNFYFSYQENTKKNHENLFIVFLDLILEQFKTPYHFQSYHKKIRYPFDYYSFGLDFVRPLIDKKNSKQLGLENIEKMLYQLKKNENIILLANHQTESDPQAISLMLEADFPKIAEKIIYVAGERVITDPLSVPFSLGCDLLCIYSKKYINLIPELKEKKQLHNRKTMKVMKDLLKEGSKIIYVAPSGGRDRPDGSGNLFPAPFDPKSIEMFYLMAKKSQTPTHFYPLSLATYSLLPPPDVLQKEMGETRKTKAGPIHICFGEEIPMDDFKNMNDRNQYIYNQVYYNYQKIT